MQAEGWKPPGVGVWWLWWPLGTRSVERRRHRRQAQTAGTDHRFRARRNLPPSVAVARLRRVSNRARSEISGTDRQRLALTSSRAVIAFSVVAARTPSGLDSPRHSLQGLLDHRRHYRLPPSRRHRHLRLQKQHPPATVNRPPGDGLLFVTSALLFDCRLSSDIPVNSPALAAVLQNSLPLDSVVWAGGVTGSTPGHRPVLIECKRPPLTPPKAITIASS